MTAVAPGTNVFAARPAEFSRGAIRFSADPRQWLDRSGALGTPDLRALEGAAHVAGDSVLAPRLERPAPTSHPSRTLRRPDG